MSNLRKYDDEIVLSASAKNSTFIEARDFIGKQIIVASDGDAAGTLYVATSTEKDIDLTASASQDNPYALIGLIDLDSRETIAGSDGITFAGATVGAYKINADYLDKIYFKSSLTDGTVNISVVLTSY